MADIELVIKLDKDIAQGIIDGKNDIPRIIVRGFQATIADAIKKGTPLPKGHGELKDTQDIINRLNLNYNNHQTISVQSIKDIVQTIPTTIEADKGENK